MQMLIAKWIEANCRFAKPTVTPPTRTPPAKKRVNRLAPPATDKDRANRRQTYLDVGHGKDKVDTSKIWVFNGRDVETAPASSNHSVEWGNDYCASTWKGRYEGDTGRLSAVSPNSNASSVPSWLMDKLEAELGAITDVTVF